MLEVEQVVDHRRQAEAGAGPLFALIEDQFVGLGVVLQVLGDHPLLRELVRQRAQQWIVQAVPIIDPVGTGIEGAVGDLLARHGSLLAAEVIRLSLI